MSDRLICRPLLTCVKAMEEGPAVQLWLSILQQYLVCSLPYLHDLSSTWHERTVLERLCAELCRGREPFRELPRDQPGPESMDPRIPAIAFPYVHCQQSSGKHPHNPPTLHPLCCAYSNMGSFLPLTTVRNCPLTRVTPPIGSFHSATMAARGCVIWGTKEPSQPPAPGTMDTPTHTFSLLTFLMAGFILFALTPGRGCSSQLRAAAFRTAAAWFCERTQTWDRGSGWEERNDCI